jgi:hypothetical protein
MPGIVKNFVVFKVKDWVLSSKYRCGLPDIIKDRLEHGDKGGLVLIPKEKWKLYLKVNKLLAMGSVYKFHF